MSKNDRLIRGEIYVMEEKAKMSSTHLLGKLDVFVFNSNSNLFIKTSDRNIIVVSFAQRICYQIEKKF